MRWKWAMGDAPRPLIKYPGGKAALAPAISAAFGEPCRGTYIEPFVGGGSVYLHRAAAGEVERAHLSDRDGWIAGLHRIVRDDPGGVCTTMAAYRGMAWTYERYDAERAWLNSAGMTETSSAACFIALNKAGFNGLFRKNKRDQINAAWGHKAHPPGIPDDAHIRQVSALLSRAAVSCSDWQRAIVIASEGDQVYLDQPYVGTWTGYGIGGTWTIDHLAELVRAAEYAVECGARVVLSHMDDEPTRALLGRWRVEAIGARASISRSVATRGARREILAVLG
jgi:DNA adenine methylase